LWLALAASGPWEVALTARRRRRLRPVVADIAPGFDVVVLSHQGMAGLLPRRRKNRWALQLHHVSSAKAVQERVLVTGRRQRWLLSRQVAKARRLERRAVDAFDVVVAVSDLDADQLSAGKGTAVHSRLLVVPNGVDTDRYRPSPLPDEARMVMTGSLNYGPNLDGAVWFCDEVLPLVRDRVPAATLALVGRSPAPEVRSLGGRDGIEVHADLASVEPWLAKARVAVVPLRVGTGTRLKALEAMAAGRPVVGTAIGLAGLGLVDGQHALMADDAVSMADAVATVLTDRPLAERLARAGRVLVQERFQWSVIADDLATALLGRVGPRTGRTA
jgi:glycosyltransferase involved in cell wall biosynthesis